MSQRFLRQWNFAGIGNQPVNEILIPFGNVIYASYDGKLVSVLVEEPQDVANHYRIKLRLHFVGEFIDREMKFLCAVDGVKMSSVRETTTAVVYQDTRYWDGA